MALFKSRKKGAWDQLSDLAPEDTMANRDVYNSQQLGRSEIGEKLSKTPRTILAIVIGIVTTIVFWMVFSLLQGIGWTISQQLGIGNVESQQTVEVDLPDDVVVPEYYTEIDGLYYSVDEDGEPVMHDVYGDEERASHNPPDWYLQWEDQMIAQYAVEPVESNVDEGQNDGGSFGSFFTTFMFMGNRWMKPLLAIAVGFAVGSGVHVKLMRKLDAENMMNDTEDINQHKGDQHIAPPEEVMAKFSWFPNVGAHSPVQPSSMISHVMLTNHGLKKVDFAQRATEDIFDEDGDIEYHKGEALLGDDGAVLTKRVPLIDEEFGDDLFAASGIKEKRLQKKYRTDKLPYNPGGENRDKTGKQDTVAEHINEEWDLPLYEPQRPSGAYLVDEAPVNTMVLAITRAGKGQTYIEPMIDMWLREKRPNNMVINDPKGELLVKHYVRATVRGYQVVQFNLINAMKTDIYNPLAMAAEAARAGDTTKCAMYVENIADVFFPVDGADDPVWPNAANNAFKRAAYGLIDYYMEEERELRAYAMRTNMDPKVLDTKLDQRWGGATLYNCYQLFVQLSAKKAKSPLKQLEQRYKSGEFGTTEEDFDKDAFEAAEAEAKAREFMWDGAEEVDMLTLYFNASNYLPKNSLRTLVSNADNALRAMGAAEKMLASVYGIAITAMSFFTDPTISSLTSGTPSQNADLAGLSFPRRIGVRFHMDFLEKHSLIGTQAKWDAFHDPEFTNPIEGEFEHEDIVSREGWARYYFKGIFPNKIAYLRLILRNPDNGMILRRFYFKFTKDYQTSLDGLRITTDPIKNEKIVKDGVLLELRPFNDKGKEVLFGDDESAIASYRPAATKFPHTKLTNLHLSAPEVVTEDVHAIIATSVRYSEQPKMVFLVTPPHLMKYAKLVLILIKQLVDLNFDQSYMTKSNQKPLYKTRFMLDELGNLQSDGQGINGLQTMLSIGLGQEQQFTIILQTLQQLRDVYGDSADKIIQGNTSNIVFLKSTDDAMLETLEKMSGTTHNTYRDSKTVTKDVEAILRSTSVEGKTSYTLSTQKEALITYNDMAFLSERNSIVFRAGDPPVWNRNEMILPMSWRLFKDTIEHPGHEYSLQTIPTTSTVMDFDVRANQPDFDKMVQKRLKQAEVAGYCKQLYQDSHGYSDTEINRMDENVYSDAVMEIVDSMLAADQVDDVEGSHDPDAVDPTARVYDMPEETEENTAVVRESEELLAKQRQREMKHYASGKISKDMLVSQLGTVDHQLDKVFAETFRAIGPKLGRDPLFGLDGMGNLTSKDGSVIYIEKLDESEAKKAMMQARENGERVFAEEDEDIETFDSFVVSEELYRMLEKQDSWLDIADGEFDREVAKQMTLQEELELRSSDASVFA